MLADPPEIADADDDEVTIASGNTAAAACARLQDEELEPALRQAPECALKRYCELNTLAMAMWWRRGALGEARRRPMRSAMSPEVHSARISVAASGGPCTWPLRLPKVVSAPPPADAGRTRPTGQLSRRSTCLIHRSDPQAA
jgi:hypothetical protein